MPELITEQSQRLESDVKQDAFNNEVREQATFGEEIKGFASAWYSGTSAPNVLEWWDSLFVSDEKNPSHIKNASTPEYIDRVSNAVHGDKLFRQKLKETTNLEQQISLTKHHLEARMHQKRINDFIDESTATAASTGGAFFSLENIAGGFFIGGAAKISRLNKARETMLKTAIATDAVMIPSVTAIRHSVDPETTTMWDVALDMSLGIGIGSIAFRSVSKANMNNIAKGREEAVTKNSEIEEAVEDYITTDRAKHSVQYPDGTSSKIADDLDRAIAEMEQKVSKNAGYKKIESMKRTV